MTETATLGVRAVGSVGIIDIEGDLTAASEQSLSGAYSRASEAGSAVALNFNGLEYMNSSGIGLLVTILIRANRQNKRLLVYGLNDHYRHIFQLTRLDDAIPILETEEEALATAS